MRTTKIVPAEPEVQLQLPLDVYQTIRMLVGNVSERERRRLIKQGVLTPNENTIIDLLRYQLVAGAI